MNIFKKLFSKKVKDPPIEAPVKKEVNLANISQFDDVWIKIDGKLFSGWVIEKVENCIYICYTNENNKLDDIVFTIERPLNRTFIEQDGKVLYLKKDDIQI